MTKLFCSERELGQAVVPMLERQGWTLYYEVEHPTGQRADIVGVRQDTTRVIELKLVLSLDLLAQAWKWVQRGVANEVQIVVPVSAHRKQRGRDLVRQICSDYGIGLTGVVPSFGAIPAYFLEQTRVRALEVRNPIRECLREEHRTWVEPGTKAGGYVTKFSLTMAKVREFVATHPGCSAADIVASVPHHYSSAQSARASLLDLGRRRVLKGLRIENPHKPRQARFYPEVDDQN